MNRCTHCNVLIFDERQACPLCHKVLDQAPDHMPDLPEDFALLTAPYPDVRDIKMRIRRWMHVLLFLLILGQAIAVAVDYFTTPGYWWSVISGIVVLYIYLFLVYWIRHDSGYALKVGLLLGFTMLLLLGIDHFTGAHGWALEYAIPGLILFGDVLVFFFMALNRQTWYSYTMLLLFVMVCSVVLLVLYLTHQVHNVVMPVLCVCVTGGFLLLTVIFGDRQMTGELKRRFHV